jgi:hypothetical protein
VLEALSFLLGKTQDLPGPLSEFIKPISIVHLSPPFHWQKVEPSPLCRSGKLCNSSYNTHYIASRITIVASRLSLYAHISVWETIDLNTAGQNDPSKQWRGLNCSGAKCFPNKKCLLFRCLRISWWCASEKLRGMLQLRSNWAIVPSWAPGRWTRLLSHSALSRTRYTLVVWSLPAR